MKKRKIRTKNRKKKTKLIIAGICFGVAILLIIGYFSYRYLWPHQPKIKVDNSKAEAKEKVEVDPKVEEIKKLYQENNDLVGWITIDNTKIDYPVMYTKGEDYYLYRDFYKNDFVSGSIYVDKHNTVKPRDVNLLIHGHSMADGSMFMGLLNYYDEEYYKEHPTITFYTLEEKEEYEIIAVFVSKVYNVDDNVFKYYKFYGSKTKEEYDDYISNIKRLSLYDIDASATYPEKLITLSTCEYSQEDGRMVVVGRKKENK